MDFFKYFKHIQQLLYAAGDIVGQPWQIAKAVGEGCVAGIEAAEYAKKLADS